MFGHEAAKLLDYVECFPSGYRKGIKIEKACSDAGIEGFPTWIINGEVRFIRYLILFTDFLNFCIVINVIISSFFFFLATNLFRTVHRMYDIITNAPCIGA